MGIKKKNPARATQFTKRSKYNLYLLTILLHISTPIPANSKGQPKTKRNAITKNP